MTMTGTLTLLSKCDLLITKETLDVYFFVSVGSIVYLGHDALHVQCKIYNYIQTITLYGPVKNSFLNKFCVYFDSIRYDNAFDFLK